MRVLVIAPYVPFEGIRHAGGEYLLRHVEWLLGWCDVALLAPASRDNLGAVESAPAGLDVHLVDIAPDPVTALQRRRRNVANLLAGLGPGAHVLKALRADPRLALLIKTANLVEVQWPYMLPLVDDVRRIGPHRPVVAIEHDVATQWYERQARAAAFLQRLKHRALHARVRQQEPRLLARCDLVCVFSAKDERLLRSMGLKAPVQVLQPWFTVPEPRTLPGNRTVVMTAAFGRPENVDAATWLLDEIWPRVRAAVPDAHLVLAGADPPGPLVDRAGDDVTWTGFLPALDDAYRQADVFVLPLRLGAGVKFRLPQAMAHGLPVVTTSTGAEGVLTDEEATAVGAVTDDASTFAAAVIALLVDPTRAREAGAAARRLVTARFQPAGNWTALRRRYSTLVGGA